MQWKKKIHLLIQKLEMNECSFAHTCLSASSPTSVINTEECRKFQCPAISFKFLAMKGIRFQRWYKIYNRLHILRKGHLSRTVTVNLLQSNLNKHILIWGNYEQIKQIIIFNLVSGVGSLCLWCTSIMVEEHSKQ